MKHVMTARQRACLQDLLTCELTAVAGRLAPYRPTSPTDEYGTEEGRRMPGDEADAPATGGDEPLTDVELERLIWDGTELVAAGLAGPEELADLGGLLIDRYGRNADDADLRRAVTLIRTALDDPLAAGHPERPFWQRAVGLCHAERAVGGSTADWSPAIDMLSAAQQGLPPGSEERDTTTLELAESLLRRYLMGRPDEPITTEPTAGRELIGLLTELREDCSAPEPRAIAGVLVAQAWLVLADDTGAGDTLDTAITLATTAVREAPREANFLAEVCYDLSDALLTRHDARSRSADIDAALDVLDLLFELAEPSDPGWILAHENEAIARERRWQLAGDPADLDRAIESMSLVVVDRHADWRQGYRYGDLLRERADRNADVAELGRAINVLKSAAEELPDGHPDGWEVWCSLGLAFERRWRLVNDPEVLARWRGSFQLALECGIPERELLLQVHLEILDSGHLLLERADQASRPARCAELRADVESAYAVLGDHDDSDLGLLLGTMAAAAETWVFSQDQVETDVDINRVAYHIERAARLGDSDTSMRTTLVGLDGLVGVYRSAYQDGGPDFGRTAFIDAVNASDPDEPSRPELLMSLVVAEMARGGRTGDRGALDTAVALSTVAGTNSTSDRAMVAFLHLQRAAQQADSGALLSALDEAIGAVEELPQDDPMRSNMQSFIRPVERMFRATADSGRTVAAPVAGGGMIGHLTFAFECLADIEALVRRGDVAELTALLAKMERRLTTVLDSVPARVAYLYVLNTGHEQLIDLLPGHRSAVETALHWSDELMALLSGPEHPLWTFAAATQARARRLRGDAGDRARSRSVGMGILRARTWSALLQSGTENAMAVVRRAADEALQLARWCAEDGAYDDLVRALDAGRALVLYAATASRTVAEQLTALGRTALADEWLRTDGTGEADLIGLWAESSMKVSGDLRHRVLTALVSGDRSATRDLLDAPNLSEIRTALLTQGSDALVYLVPGVDSGPGMAVLVPTRQPVSVLPLPGLLTDPGSPIARYAEAFGRRREGNFGSAVDSPWRLALGEVIDWAWRCVGAELMSEVDRIGIQGNPHLVFVPVGTLALVPWHAARRSHGTGVRYLAEDAVISYTPSARLLCETVARPPVPAGAALVVGNPTGDLESAGAEARAIHEVFYPQQTYLGHEGSPAGGDRRRARGPGTPQEVLDWLVSGEIPRKVLHLACHASAEPGNPVRSRLILDGQAPLFVRDLLDRAPTRRLVLDRVFLAACTTNVSGDDYDEAFSLASAFLAVGARTAFGSLWEVPDGHTSLLMFMTHHYLDTEACSPADALHRAQLWMLDPRRVPLDTMTDEMLCGPGSAYAPSDPVCWAGFTHLGA